jgi:hypothetical protein
MFEDMDVNSVIDFRGLRVLALNVHRTKDDQKGKAGPENDEEHGTVDTLAMVFGPPALVHEKEWAK